MVEELSIEDKEEWRPVVGYEGLYEVSNQGRVKTLQPRWRQWRGHILRGWKSCGYWQVVLYRNQKSTNHLIHRVVITAFVGPCPDEHEVNHKDGDKDNNRQINLEYVTRSANAQHALAIGRRARGSMMQNAKLCEESAIRILALGKAYGVAKLAREHGVKNGTISALLNGKTWKHVPRG